MDPLTQGSRWFRRHRLAAWVILTVLFIVSLIGLITFYLPDQVRSWQFWTQKPEDVRNLSLVVLGCISVLAGSIGVVFSYFRTSAANLQAQIAEQGHITDRFTKAVEQLGNDKLEVRLGAIYALERIARDSRRDHGPIMETLIAYVRENAPWPPKGDAEGLEELLAVAVSADGGSRGGPTDEEKPVRADEEPARAKPRTDVQAALTVLGRREWRHDVEGVSLNLAETDLRGANLHSAVLEGADLGYARLERANLRYARLEGTNLKGAYLHDAQGLTQEQLGNAYGDEETKLPKDMTIRLARDVRR